MLTAEALRELPLVAPDAVYAYGQDVAQQFGHLYLPETKPPYPTVMLLHGGCWREGFGLDYFGQAAKALSRVGFAVWNLEYRRLGIGGGWPETFADVARGSDFLRTIASIYDLDLSRLAVIGHSAGGHLASWLAVREYLPEKSQLYQAKPLQPDVVMSIAGIPDLTEALKQGICANQAPAALMGGHPHELPERYQQGSPAELPPTRARQLFFQGALDDIVPLGYTQNYVAKARARGESISLKVLQDTGHIEPVIATTWQWRELEQALLELF